MKKNALTKIRCALKTEIQKAGKTSPTMAPRLSNIKWIKNLSRKGLSCQEKERQLLIHTTSAGERIFIQYPGKESKKYQKNGKQRKESAICPWDFRPELYLSGNRECHKSMSFFDIWATIFETAKKLTEKNRAKTLRVFVILLYRMAFMLDHIELENFKTQARDIAYRKNGKTKITHRFKITLPTQFKYKPNEQAVDYIASKCPRWGEMSLEGFLFYNELLAWNEDCKYYYKKIHTKDKTKWINKTGRVNTLLTHIRILGYMLGEVPLSDIFGGFVNGKGVSPASKDEIPRICGDFIKTS